MSPLADHDPDLAQAIEDLRYTAPRMEFLDRQLVELDEVQKYHQVGRIRAERADHRDIIAARAEKLNITPRALLLIIEWASRMRTPRRADPPSLNALAATIRTVVTASERDRLEAAANAKDARLAERDAITRAKAAADALTYLEASR